MGHFLRGPLRNDGSPVQSAFRTDNKHNPLRTGNRIMKQIRTYVPIVIGCGGEELEALDDILAKKVMRKLGMQNPVYIRNQADRFCSYMAELFGEDGMPQCKAVVQRLKLNA